jgi:hypothetical protein
MRAKWKPSPEQLEAAIDAAVARVPVERAAELLGVKPRTLRSFCRRLEACRGTVRNDMRKSSADNAESLRSRRPEGAGGPDEHP